LAYFISFDIETGGEYAGIVQLSAQLCIVKLTDNGSSTLKDKAESIIIAPEVFDSYVNPNKPHGLWDECAIAVHGIAPKQRRITEADDMRIVSHNFMERISRNLPAGELTTLVAWNGAACDMKWLWVLTQAPNSPHMTPKLPTHRT
jgi:DNA polymerase III epsilon subunit-like protein